MSSYKKKHVLVAVLDWGLGHATRSMPIIQCLLAHDCNVSIASNGLSLVLLKQEFPELVFHELPAHQITYPSHRFFLWHLFWQAPKIMSAIRKERKQIDQLLHDHHFSAIISDNRYGCYSDQVLSVLITHQLNVQLPPSLSWARNFINYFNHHLIKKFDRCWVPDFPAGFTGKLSESKNLNVKFVGMLSRFAEADVFPESYRLVGLVSGPEPQRDIFEKLLIKEFTALNQPGLIVRGIPNQSSEEIRQGCISLLSHAPANQLKEIISTADIIISRSGYSTIMDLYALRKKRVIFVPTPGQTEQEYLAGELERRTIAYTQAQDKFNLAEAIAQSKQYHGFDASTHQPNLLNEAVEDLLHQI
ncbi:MAG: hypothetical protein RI909_1792 [Bacteroidota bacterium]|jgi:uncharacterized protein (TIGR00661 family)